MACPMSSSGRCGSGDDPATSLTSTMDVQDGGQFHLGTLSDELLRLLVAYNQSAAGDQAGTAQPPQQVHPGGEHNPFSQPWWLELTYAVAFGVMLTVATVGNAIVIWAVLSHHVMRSPTNYFLVNVSVADLLMATGNGVFSSTYMVHVHWPFGAAFCVLSNFMANFTVALSVFSLLAISVDRYTAIMNPLRPRMSTKVVLMSILLIWLTSGLLSLPNLLYSTTQSMSYANGSVRTVCYLQWPDGVALDSELDYAYNVLFLVVTYVLPISTMSFAYLRMGRKLWRSTLIGECCDKQIGNMKSKRRVVRMFIVVVAIFAVCWLPYHAYFIVTAHFRTAIHTWYTQHVFLCFYWLAMSNTMYNPIIYVKMNARFRQYFLTVLRCGRAPGPHRTYSTSCGQFASSNHQCSMSMTERHSITARQPTDRWRCRTTNGHHHQQQQQQQQHQHHPNGQQHEVTYITSSRRRQVALQEGEAVPVVVVNGVPTTYYDQNGHTGVDSGHHQGRRPSSRVSQWFRRSLGTAV